MNLSEHLRFAKFLALSAVFAAFTVSAHASTITYDLTGVTTSAGTLIGTVDIDTITKLVTSADITFNDVADGSPVFTNIGSPNAYNGLGQDYISGTSNGPLNWGGQIALYYSTANLGTGDLSICLAVGPCGTESNQTSFAEAYVSRGRQSPFLITSGTLDPDSGTNSNPAITPEPTSLVMLGTGILAIAALMARMSYRSS